MSMLVVAIKKLLKKHLDDVDSKELSRRLSRTFLSDEHEPEVVFLNSWAVVFNQISPANLPFKSKET